MDECIEIFSIENWNLMFNDVIKEKVYDHRFFARIK